MKRIPAILMTVVMLLCAAAGAFADAGADIKVGEYITFGRYPQTSAGTDETPIEWLVLDVQDGKALLLSRYGLDAKPYNTSLVDVTWETCSLRAWLNSDFLNAAFNAEEQNAIQVTEVDNSKAQGCDEWSTDGGNNTQDKLFLLSYGESNRYFGTNRSDTDVVAARIKPTDFAIAQGAETRDAFMTEYNTPAGGWMLRSPALKQSNVACVYIAGKVSYGLDGRIHGDELNGLSIQAADNTEGVDRAFIREGLAAFPCISHNVGLNGAQLIVADVDALDVGLGTIGGNDCDIHAALVLHVLAKDAAECVIGAGCAAGAHCHLAEGSGSFRCGLSSCFCCGLCRSRR